jgi:zinc D-Ala-D-Ala carboxypeptidase
MTSSRRERATTRRRRIRPIRVATPLLVIAAVAAVLGHGLPSSPSSTATADGAVHDRTTVFADEVPGVVNLDPELLAALRRAATAASEQGVELVVDSGWRSAAYQEQLRREAVSKHGSEEEAARWVATAETSAHVSGDAVDIGPSAAAAWLSEHGAGFGLCRIYDNEPWHYELRPQAVDEGCPPTYADPTHDPRMGAAAAERRSPRGPPLARRD